MACTRYTNTPIHFVIELFRALGLQYIIVLQKGKLVGIVRRLDLVTHLAFYQRLLDRQREHEQEMEQVQAQDWDAAKAMNQWKELFAANVSADWRERDDNSSFDFRGRIVATVTII